MVSPNARGSEVAPMRSGDERTSHLRRQRRPPRVVSRAPGRAAMTTWRRGVSEGLGHLSARLTAGSAHGRSREQSEVEVVAYGWASARPGGNLRGRKTVTT